MRSHPCCIAFIFLLSLASASGTTYAIDGLHDRAQPVRVRTASTIADAYTPHLPIIISSNGDFESQGWPGNGTEDAPYILENLNITSSDACITITDTSAYFEIKHCLLSSSDPSESYPALAFGNVTHFTISGTTAEKHVNGFNLFLSANGIIADNTAIGNSVYNFYLGGSDGCVLTNNSVTGTTGGYAFYIQDSAGCNLTSNTGTAVASAFLVDRSGGCMLTNNSAYNVSGRAFHLFNAAGCTLTNNSAVGTDGFRVEASPNCTMDCNYASDSVAAGFYLEGSPFSTLTKNAATDNSDGFYLMSLDCTLVHNSASGNAHDGFYLYASRNGTLTNNSAIGNLRDGFGLDNSDGCILTNNTATENVVYGIRLVGSAWNTLFLNRIGPNGLGNALDTGTDNMWDDGVSLGNYWSDYIGVGVYTIPGDADSVDRFPSGPITNITTTSTTNTTAGYGAVLVSVAAVAGAVGVIEILKVRRERMGRTDS